MDEIEIELHAQLGIPLKFQSRSGAAAASGDLSEALHDRECELAELRREGDRIGLIPKDYPRHITWIMRIIAALLPWYTRPLANFGRRTSLTAEATLRLAEEMGEPVDEESAGAPSVSVS